MRNTPLLITLFASLTATAAGCAQTECATGTIERDGTCQPATAMSDPSQCGPGTELQGDQCVPVVAETHCDPATTIEQVNEDGTITCVGNGTGGDCSTPIACPTPSGSATKLTICGQIFDFENNSKFADSTGAGNCDASMPAASGPCALQIIAYDAIAFGTNPATAAPLAVDSVTIDKCGRYRVAGIETNGTGPFIGLGIDDAGQPLGPAGVTVTVGIAAPKAEGPVIQGFEGWIVKASTTALWAANGGPPLSGGIYAPVYRKHKKGVGDPFENQNGVTVVKASDFNPVGAQDHYFPPTDPNRQNTDTAATATGVNGTALFTGAKLSDGLYSGLGGLGAGCTWDTHAGASLPGIVFIQIFRKHDAAIGGPCND
ncbi:MAG TPA: hypothetical protein VMZ53_32420 [Kofleriaceae bacterium]|nr:hypothetical protein [Kofleriaceae bacterium]